MIAAAELPLPTHNASPSTRLDSGGLELRVPKIPKVGGKVRTKTANPHQPLATPLRHPEQGLGDQLEVYVYTAPQSPVQPNHCQSKARLPIPGNTLVFCFNLEWFNHLLALKQEIDLQERRIWS